MTLKTDYIKRNFFTNRNGKPYKVGRVTTVVDIFTLETTSNTTEIPIHCQQRIAGKVGENCGHIQFHLPNEAIRIFDPNELESHSCTPRL
jgi:hypothetical protein